MDLISIIILGYILWLIFKGNKYEQNEIKPDCKNIAKSSPKDLNIPTKKTSNSSQKGVRELKDVQHELFWTIQYTKTNIFIQGQAGTGKSTLVKNLLTLSNKKIRVVCPTALAAVNIGGSTIHSLFGLPLSSFIDLNVLQSKKFSNLKQILDKTDLLIIDEVSMVRPDMLDAIDLIAKKVRRNKMPFGGIQMLLIGDLCQLPPVITSNAYANFRANYGYQKPYFFDAESYKQADFKKIELTTVYRQSDTELLKNLTKIRQNTDIDNAIDYFNTCKISDEKVLKNAITITPYKAVAESINHQRLEELKTFSKIYSCQAYGTFSDGKNAPAPRILALKVGALVIFNKNNSSGAWINGTSGIVEKLDSDVITVRILANNNIVKVKKEEWNDYKYVFDKEKDIVIEKNVGKFIQFPLQLGYAITIHKAQGKTLDKVIINIDKGAFDHGQLYVALSRTRKKSDMHICGRICKKDVIIDRRIVEFLS